MDPTPILQPAITQPRILSSFTDAFGRFHVIDEHGETVLPHCCTGGTNFALSVDWSGGRAECHWSYTDDAANNRSYVNVELWCGTSGFTTHGDFSGTIRNGWDTGVYVPGVSIGGTLVKVTGVERWIDHASDGSLNMQVGVVNGEVLNTSFNNVTGVQTHTLTDYVRTPAGVATPTASSVTATGMTWSWTAPSSPSAIVEYLLEYSTSSSFSNSTVVSTGTSLSKAITGLSSGTTYYARVGARNADGWSPQGGTGSKATLASAPTGLTLSASTTSGMTADWADVTGATGYDIQYGTSSSFSGATTTTSTSSTKALTGLAPATKYYVRVRAKGASGTGAWSSSANRATVPVTVASLALSAPTTTSITATWTKGTNGSEITSYDVQWDDNVNFSSPVTVNTTATTVTLTGMSPGITHFVRVRAKNAVGTGVWSTTSSQTTLPSVPPGLTVAASPDGKSAVLTFSPPGSVTGVDLYKWERRATGTTTPVATGSEADTSETVTGLNPGSSYDWRASAVIDTYESPQSNWLTLKQPKPNVGAGDYFDGNTTDTADIDYAWTGTANSSTSTATAKGVLGWVVVFASGGAGVLSQITGGLYGSYAARVTVKADATADRGVSVGTRNSTPGYADVDQDGDYVGSMWVRPSKSQRLRLRINWYDAAGVNLNNQTDGTPLTVAADTWTRITASGHAAPGAKFATIRAEDISGSGWSAWQGGDTLDADGAMITLSSIFDYFDGDTLDNDSYRYDWVATPHQSASTRTHVDVQHTDPLADPDCPPAPAPPRPPAIPDVCIIETGQWRRYYASIPASEVSDWLSVVPTLEIETGSKAARQVRVRVYPNPFDYPPDAINVDEWCSEQIISYVPPHTIMTLDGITQRVWAEVSGAGAKSADHLLYGSNGTPATWPILTCGIGYLLSLEAPLDAPAGNVDIRVALTRRS